MTDIKSLTLDELTKEMEAIGEKKFRAAQIYSWMHERLADDFDQMTNLSKNLREKLKENYELTRLELVRVQTSKIDGTSKFLFRLSDGNVIESVLMKYHHGQFCLHLFSGRMPYGMPLLCIYSGWVGAWLEAF